MPHQCNRIIALFLLYVLAVPLGGQATATPTPVSCLCPTPTPAPILCPCGCGHAIAPTPTPTPTPTPFVCPYGGDVGIFCCLHATVVPATPVPSVTPLPTPVPTPTPVAVPTVTPAPTATPMPTPTPTASPAPTPTPLALGALQVGGAFPFAPDTPILEVFFINLGRADGIFLRCGGQTLLVDGGHRSRYWRLKDFLLKENGSLTLDSILNTHEHDDHVTGQIALYQDGGSAKRFYTPLPTTKKNAYYKTLRRLLAKADTEYVQIFPGDLLALGGSAPGDGAVLLADGAARPQGSALLQVFRYEGNLYDPNLASVVLRVSFGDRSILLMADATGKAQHDLFNRFGDSLSSDVIKSAHHGITGTVPTLLEAVDPSLMVITSFPKRANKQRLQAEYIGLPLLYSGQGTIYMATDGQAWYVRQDPPVPSPDGSHP